MKFGFHKSFKFERFKTWVHKHSLISVFLNAELDPYHWRRCKQSINETLVEEGLAKWTCVEEVSVFGGALQKQTFSNLHILSGVFRKKCNMCVS